MFVRYKLFKIKSVFVTKLTIIFNVKKYIYAKLTLI